MATKDRLEVRCVHFWIAFFQSQKLVFFIVCFLSGWIGVAYTYTKLSKNHSHDLAAGGWMAKKAVPAFSTGENMNVGFHFSNLRTSWDENLNSWKMTAVLILCVMVNKQKTMDIHYF